MKNILLLNGPNLDMLGTREPQVYGRGTLADLERMVRAYGKERGVRVECFQSNSEGALVDAIHGAQDAFDGIVYNPGAHTHYSYALRDALGGIEVPCVEVHISDVDAREAFRRVSVIAPACVAQVKGRGFQGYCDAVDILLSGASERLGEGYEARYASGQVIVGGASNARGYCGAGAPDGVSADALQGSDAGAAASPAASPAGKEAPAPASPEGPGPFRPDASACRLARLREACAREGIDAFLVRDTSNIRWLTAFDGVFDDEDAHALLVDADAAALHTDSRYAEAARAAARAGGSDAAGAVEVDGARATHAEFAIGRMRARRAGAAGDAAPAVLGIEDGVTLAEYRRLEAAAAGDGGAAAEVRLRETRALIVSLRGVKDAGEIARLKAAQAITDAAFSHIVGFMRPGMTEREVQIELEDYMRRRGADGLAFPSIVATGANGASPHAVPGATRLEAGHCVVMDFGARAHGYCSDMTRTVFLGRPDARLRDAYAVLRRANEAVEAALRPGVTGADMHALAERVLDEGGFGGAMGHALGHGVGIDIHEEPVLAPRNAQPLAEGNVVTVEPGIYLPGEFGMRLEDFGAVTCDGFEVFTKSTHDMVII